MKKLVTLLGCFLMSLTPSLVKAQTGLEGTPQIQLNINGTSSWYNPPPSSNLGTFTSSSTLSITGGGANIYKNYGVGDDVTGVTLKYRVYEQGTSAPAYTSISLDFDNQWYNSGGYAKQYWAKTGLSINLLSGVTGPKTYKLDVQFDWNYTYTSGGGGSGTGSGATYAATFNTDSSLPITLAGFTAQINQNKATLAWTTTSEQNTDCFEVEHTANGYTWHTVGTVKSSGSSVGIQNYSYLVENLEVGQHRFRLKKVDQNGLVAYSSEVAVTVGVPDQYVMYPAYPNPFNPETTLSFAVARKQAVSVEVFNALGQKVQTLFSGTVEANTLQKVSFQAAGLASGAYLVRLLGEGFANTQKIMLAK